jgi:hypothetical protein
MRSFLLGFAAQPLSTRGAAVPVASMTIAPEALAALAQE